MKSRRSWLIGLALGAALSFGAPSVQAQVPRLISYQGLMVDSKSGAHVGGQHIVEVKYYDASSAGTLLLDEMHPSILFTDGVFNLFLGSPGSGFPAGMTFNQPYWMEVTLDPGAGAGEQIFPRQEMLSAPYALNSERVGGIAVSPLPVNGNLWPVPVDGTGKIDPSVLPVPTPGITTLNAVGPDAGGGVSLLPGNGITITPNASTHTILISGPNSGGIDTITAGPGITTYPGNGISTNVTVKIGDGQITNNMVGPGAIAGSKISQIAGNGLIQDNGGLLDVNVDNSTLTISNNFVMIAAGGIGTAQIANGAVNLNNPNSKVNGILPVANGGTGVPSLTVNGLLLGNGTSPVNTVAIGGNGMVLTSNGTLPVYANLTTGVSLLGNGTTTPFAINLANPNTWTATQTFNGAPGVIGTNAQWTNTTNQVQYGPLAGPNTTINIPTPAASRVVTLPDAGGNSSYVLTTSTGGQSITTTGAAASLNVSSNSSLVTNPALTITGTTVHNGAVTITGATGITGVTTHTGAVNLAGGSSPIQLAGLGGAQGAIIASNGAANTPVWVGPGTTTTVLHGNAAGLPSYSAVALTTDISGTLPVANGGTGNTTLTAGSLLIGNGVSAVTQLADVAAGSVLASGGVGAAPIWSSGAGVFILNGTTQQNPANFNISGNGTIGGNLIVTGTSTFSNSVTIPGLAANSNVRTGTGGVLTTGAINLAGGAAEVSGILPVANGGTGAATLAANGVVLGNGASPVNVTAAGSSAQVLRIPTGGGAPAFGAVDLTQGAAVSGALPVTNGGTGAATFAAGVVHANGTTALTSSQVNLTTEVTGTLPVGNGGTGVANPAAGALLVGSGAAAMTQLSDVAAGSVLASGGVGAAPVWSSGSGLFILNSTVQQSPANFNISGNGTLGGNLSVSGSGTITGLTSTGALTVNGNITQNTLGGFNGIQTIQNTTPGTYTYTWPDKSGTVAMLSDLATNVQASILNHTLRGNGLGGWNDAGNFQNDGTNLTSTGNLSFTGSGSLLVSGTGSVSTLSGNISTATGALATGNNTAAGRVLFGDGATANLGNVTINPLAANRSYTLIDPGANANFILSTSPAGQTINNGLTVNGGETVNGLFTANNAASITGGINNNGGGITNAGAISGATTITASGLINGGSFQNTLNNFNVTGAGAITATSLNAGSGTIVTTGNINGGTFQNALNNFNVTGAGAITATSVNAGSGTIQTTGSVSGGSLTATTAGANITGGLTLTGTGPLTTSGSAGTAGWVLISNGGAAAPSWTNTITVATMPFTNLTSGTNTVAAMLVGTGASLNFTGTGTINSSTLLGNTWASPQAIGTGTAAAGTFTNLTTTTGGLNLNNNGITNTGSIAGATTITANGLITTSGNITTTGAGTITSAGLLTASNGLTVTTGGATINGLLTANSGAKVSGGLDMNGSSIINALGITATGNINGGSFQNTLNNFNVTGAGAITGTSLNAGSGTIQTTGSVSGGSLTATTGGANITGGLTLAGTGPLTTAGSAGTAGWVLISNGGAAAPSWTNALTVTTIPFGNVTSGTNANALLVSGSLAPTGAGTVTANQFVGTGSTTNAVDLATAEVAGTLPVGSGGTGATSFTSNGVVLGGATLTSTAAGTANQVLRIPGGGGAPVFGAIDLSQAAAVTNTLAVANGGSGQSAALTPGGIVYGASATAMGVSAAGTTGQILFSGVAGAPVWASGAGSFIVNNFLTPATVQTNSNFNISNNGTIGGTLTTSTAGDNFSGNSVGTPTLTLSNAGVGGSALTITAGTASLLNTTITGAATVTGVTNINTSGSAATNIGTGTYTGTTSIGNAGSTNTIAGTTGITGPTTITGATNINNTGSAATNIATGSGTLTIGNAGSTTSINGGPVNVSGATNITGATSVSGNFTATGNTQLNGPLTATGNATFGGTISANNVNGSSIGTTSLSSTALTVQNSNSNGGEALMVRGGLGSYTTGDGSGQTALSPQIAWADQVAVPAAQGSTMTIYNNLVSGASVIIVTPITGGAGTAGVLQVTSVGVGSFTVTTSAAALGTTGGGSVTALNYEVVNH